MRILPLFALGFALIRPASALDVSGNVLDKLGDPISGASVCIKSDPASCVATNAEGAFHLVKAIAVRKPGAGASAFSLNYLRGSLIVRSPAAVPARVEWLSANGRHLWAASEVKLAAGANPLALPEGLPHAGLCILRISTPDQILTWKAMLAPGFASASGSASTGTPRIASLSKAAAATLEISKSGYRTRTYDPSGEVETDAVIYLSQTADVGLTFGGNISEKVVSIDHTKKTIITESTDASCDSVTNAVVHETVQDTQKYAVRGGNLWTWIDGDCTGQMFTGTATDIVGTWTMVDPNALLPSDLRNGCIADQAGNESSFETFSAQYVISETNITGTISAETCPGDYFGFLFAYAFYADSTVNLFKNTCKEISFTNGKGETATFDFSKVGDTLHTAYAFKTSPCAMDMYFGLSAKDPTCPEGEELTRFFTCLQGSGFATPAVAKVSAQGSAPLPMSRLRRSPPTFAKIPKASWFVPLREAGLREGYISRLWKMAAPRK
jgi:hypothetical protein